MPALEVVKEVVEIVLTLRVRKPMSDEEMHKYY